MKRSLPKESSLVKKIVKISVAILILIIFFIILYIWRLSIPSDMPSGITIIGKNTYIVIPKTPKRKILVFSVPSNIMIDGVHGYGLYSIDALYRLGLIADGTGELVIESLEESFAYPIRYYITDTGNSTPQLPDLQSAINRYFSFSSSPSLLHKQYFTNMNMFQYLFFLVQLKSASFSDMDIIDISNTPVLVDFKQLDDTSGKKFDKTIFDHEYQTILENPDIRREALNLAIYNTTSTLGLGTHMEHILTRAGAYVLEVDTDPVIRSTCEYNQSSKIKKSQTVKFLEKYFNCSLVKENEIPDGYDIAIWLGSSYEKRFLPYLIRSTAPNPDF